MQALRGGILFPGGRGLLRKLIGLIAWCNVTVLRLESCGLGEGGGLALAETLRLNSTVTSLCLAINRLGEGGGRSLAETLRLNTTLTSLNLYGNDLGEGGGQTLAETLHLNTMVTSIDFSDNGMAEEVWSALYQDWGDRGWSLVL